MDASDRRHRDDSFDTAEHVAPTPQQSASPDRPESYSSDPLAAQLAEIYREKARLEQPQKRICGIRSATFFLTLGLLVVVAILVVGAGVGASLTIRDAKRDAEEARSSAIAAALTTITANVTVTVFSSLWPSATPLTSDISLLAVGNVTLDCPSLDTTIQTVELGGEIWQFAPECSMDLVGDGIDLMVVAAFRFEDCMRACASLNQRRNSDECVAITFNRRLELISTNGGNCVLKNGTGTTTTLSDSAWENTYIAATLLGRG